MNFVARYFLIILSSIVLFSGCVYQANISQGNFIEAEDIGQIEIGMTKNQIRFLLGTPMIDDPFNEDRWDYIYYLKVGRDNAIFKKWISLTFENNQVTEINDDRELNSNL